MVYLKGADQVLNLKPLLEEQRCLARIVPEIPMKKTPRSDKLLYRTLFGKRMALTFSSSAMRRWEHYGRVFNLSLVESKRTGVNENKWMVVAATSSTNITGRGKTPQGARGALLREIRKLQRGLSIITADL